MKHHNHALSGSGGGRRPPQPPAAYVPRRATNNLFSGAKLKIAEVLEEGPIGGLVNGHQSILINGTPLQNSDGSYNFEGVSVDFRYGTPNQTYIPGFEETGDETTVNAEVKQGFPVTRTISNSNANAATVTVTVPRLLKVTDKGDRDPTDIELQIAVQYNNGGFVTVIGDTISGYTDQAYQRSYRLDLNGPFPVDIRVTRITPDSADLNTVANSFSWSSYSPIISAKLSYPNTALNALGCDAEQFSSEPTRAYFLYHKLIQIPSNATVDQATGRLIYSGVWNGTFGAAQWCADPAWALWDLCINDRFGLGQYIDVNGLDRYALYAASQRCAELVPNGFGGREPRYTANGLIRTPEEAYQILQDLCSVMDAMPYPSTGALTVAQDRPGDAEFEFSNANVVGGKFDYSDIPIKNRPTVCKVKYFDNDLRDYTWEVVEYQELIARYGYISVEIEAKLCTSRGQAWRAGMRKLFTEWNQSEVVAFTSDLAAGVRLRPGSVVRIADSLRLAGNRPGGRVATATASQITVDDATGLAIGSSATLSVQLPSGDVETRGVNSITGNVFAMAAPFSAAPAKNAMWSFETASSQLPLWRLLSIKPDEKALRYDIAAISYSPNKWAYIERGMVLEPRPVPQVAARPAQPENLSAVETLYEQGGRALAKLQISWASVAGASSYRIAWRRGSGNWQTATSTSPSYEVLDAAPGSYEVQVRAVNYAQAVSASTAGVFQAIGRLAPPSTPTGLAAALINSTTALLSWTQAPDLDVRLGGSVLLRHSPRLDGPAWGEAVEVAPPAAGNATSAQVPLLAGSYLAKFCNSEGVESVDRAIAAITSPPAAATLTVANYAEHLTTPPFNGACLDVFYSSAQNALAIGGGPLIGSHPSIAALASIAITNNSLAGSVLSVGEYFFGQSFDMGGVFDVLAKRRLLSRFYNQIPNIGARPGLVGSWSSITGEAGASSVNAALLIRETLDNPAVQPQWGPWREMVNGAARGRGFQLKLLCTSDDPAANILVSELGASIELAQRVEQSATLTTTAAAYAVTFPEAFYQPPTIGINAYNLATGDYYFLDPASVTTTGFTVEFRTSAGSLVGRQFSYSAVGYGRKIT